MSAGKALVLGSDTRSFLTVIRSLGRKGIQVHIAWHRPDSAAQYSRYVKKRHGIPKFVPEDDAWKIRFQEVLRKEAFDLVIPCDDPSIIPLQIHRKDFEGLSKIYLVDDRTFEITINKRKTLELARSLNIPVPREMEVEAGSNQLGQITPTLSFPIVLKPYRSVTANELYRRNEVRKAFSAEEFKRHYQEMAELGPILIQENFKGFGCGVELIADRGTVLSAFQHQRVHEPLLGGGGPYRKSVALHPGLYGAAEKMIKALGYTGVAMVEFKMNPETGQWVFLEINARFWGSLPLAVAAGIDFPWYLYELLVHGNRDFNRQYRQGLYCRNLVGDLEWLRTNLSADHSDPSLHTVPLKNVVSEIGNIVRLKEKSDTLTVDDPVPGLVDLSLWLKTKAVSLREKLVLRHLSTGGVKARMRREIIRAMQACSEIEFVCHGNICRSPFAERYARNLFGNRFEIRSSGVSPLEGRPSPEEAKAAAREFGIDLTPHLSKSFRGMGAGEKLLFVFDRMTHQSLKANHPRTKGRVFYLGAFLDGAELNIDDPYGQGRQGFRTAYKAISVSLTRLKHELDAA